MHIITDDIHLYPSSIPILLSAVNSNSRSQDCTHPDDHNLRDYDICSIN